jgi:dGTPase
VAYRFLAGERPGLEAQLCNLADAIAYNAHDIDDGVRSGLITLAQLRAVPLFDRYRAQAQAQYPQLAERRLLNEAIRRMLSDQVYDVIDTTREAMAAHAPASVDAVRRLPVLVGFSPAMREQSQALKHFLFEHLYRHPQVMQTTDGARQVVRELFGIYQSTPDEMPPAQAAQAREGGAQHRARTVADFIAGMTDRFALREHERLTGQRLLG